MEERKKFQPHDTVLHNHRDGESTSSYISCTTCSSSGRVCPALWVPPLPDSVCFSEKFCGEDLAVFRLLPLSGHFFLCTSTCWHQLWFHVCLRRGGGFIFLIVWLRSIPALSYVIHGASLCLLAKIP